MKKVRLGRSNLLVSRSSFGCIPIQRLNHEEAVRLLRRAYDEGINFFDTARGYSDSEEKLGHAFHAMRHKVIIATKTPAANDRQLVEDLKTSLKNLQTDYIDIYQLHNPSYVPMPGGEDGLYDALVKAREKGMIRHIGITNHALNIAEQAVCSGLYETLQFPFSCLATEMDEGLANLCKDKDVGFIAMKAMAGGLIQNVRANFSYITTFSNIVPIWGMQRESELNEFVSLEKELPSYDEEMYRQVMKERELLSGEFCRGCGYCLPCPADIEIPLAARMDKFLTRSVAKKFTSPEWQRKMSKIQDCILCMQCAEKCPYKLKPYEVLKKQIAIYNEFLKNMAP
ncbi:MAG: aldo/keto reductase [Christensenellales bacterium]